MFMVNQPRHSRATLKGLLIHSFTDSHKNMCSTYDEIMRRGEVAKPINYADSVYTLRIKRSPAHILSRTPSRKNGSERVYTVSLAERWASNVDGRNEKLASFNEKLYLMNLNHARVEWKITLLLFYSNEWH